MADLSGFDRLWLGLLRAPVSMWARPHVLPEDLRARFAQRERPVCYVLNEAAAADLVVLEKVCAAHGLPAPSQALKKPLPSESVLFLERRAGFWGDRTDYRMSDSMRALVSAAFNDPTLDVDADLSPEGSVFVSATDSPTGKPLLISGNEVSSNTAVYEINVVP